MAKKNAHPERRPLELPRSLVEYVLLGPTDDRRQLQDSPILGDVWIAYASRPAELHDILITPHKREPSARIAKYVHDRLSEAGRSRGPGQEPRISYLQGVVAARLFFDEVLRFLVPATQWWHDKRVMEYLTAPDGKERLVRTVGLLIASAAARDSPSAAAAPPEYFSALDRYITLAGLILWADRAAVRSEGRAAPPDVSALLARTDGATIIAPLQQAFERMLDEPMPVKPLIWQVSLNRQATPALGRSVPAVKADAARTLFKVKCDEIGWAVVDSGIDVRHQAFQDAEGNSRVVSVYDFSQIRKIISIDNLTKATRDQHLDALLGGHAISRGTASRYLEQLAAAAVEERPVDWGIVEKLVEIAKPGRPYSQHGTHVAGILGGAAVSDANAGEGYAGGVCPDIMLYDFRVLAKTIEDTEYAIIAALQFIRYLNERKNYMTIHGANLSLSIPHNVRNYACGRTPICVECERLIESGVSVVAAAGNRGYHSFATDEGSYEGYAAFSITDPGNADGVITVGSTHRHWPHTYGVSFFSSRGPTGDGRLKPDLVAPGERIHAPLPDGEWGQMDGTSMAAPHVSGAAAMLMARYSELIGQPRRIKRILVESATDLGRERSFQGRGMLDVLRAFQSI